MVSLWSQSRLILLSTPQDFKGAISGVPERCADRSKKVSGAALIARYIGETPKITTMQ